MLGFWVVAIVGIMILSFILQVLGPRIQAAEERRVAETGYSVENVRRIVFIQNNWKEVCRALYKATHPDHGGTNLEFLIAQRAIETQNLVQVLRLSDSYGLIEWKK